MTPVFLALALIVPRQPAEPNVEVVLDEQVLTDLFRALTPTTRTTTQDIGVGRVTLHVRLSDPVVKVSPKTIVVTMKYRATDAGGLIDISGTATPEVAIVPVRAKRIFEARIVRGTITLPGNIELPLQNAMDPIVLPAIVAQEVSLGDKRVEAVTQGTEVVLEKGRVRIRGVASFRSK